MSSPGIKTFAGLASEAPNYYLRKYGWEIVQPSSSGLTSRALRCLTCGTENEIVGWLTTVTVQDYMHCKCTAFREALAYDPSNA